MAGVSGPHADATSDAGPEVFSADLNPAYYWFRLLGGAGLALFFAACAPFFAARLGVVGKLVVFSLCTFAIGGIAANIWSVAKILGLANPLVRIDSRGIWDKRLTYDPIPWGQIRAVHRPGFVAPFLVKVDVGIPQVIGVKFTPWSRFGIPRQAITIWNDPVISVWGLKVGTLRPNEDLGDVIVRSAKLWHAHVARGWKAF